MCTIFSNRYLFIPYIVYCGGQGWLASNGLTAEELIAKDVGAEPPEMQKFVYRH